MNVVLNKTVIVDSDWRLDNRTNLLVDLWTAIKGNVIIKQLALNRP